MSPGVLFFTLCSAVALAGALLTVLAKNPIRSAVGLLATIFGIAGLFLKLSAEFMAAIQLIVYAGAVVVLFVFVIMLLGPDAGASASSGVPKARLTRVLAGVVTAGLAVGLLSALSQARPGVTPFPELTPGYGTVEAVGRQLYTQNVVPFELATALLIVAVVGAIAVARGRVSKRILKSDPNPSRRFFHGPLLARDAGRPIPKGGTS
jgi:NADH-quinone oxidoreductase subunit J